jgi:hypothetical protein
MSFQNTPLSEINLLNELIFKPSDFNLTQLKPEAESQEYSAHRFQLNKQQIIFRVAKITATKTGQFVSIWKRSEQGITTPFDVKDDLDFLMIATKTPTQFGIFIFPKKVLLEHRVLSDETRDGKRGIRIYPNWDETTSKQAQKTQFWQTEYFLDLSNEHQIDLNRAKKLLI